MSNSRKLDAEADRWLDTPRAMRIRARIESDTFDEEDGRAMYSGIVRRPGCVKFDESGPVLTSVPVAAGEMDEGRGFTEFAARPQPSPLLALQCMDALLTWAGDSKARLLAVRIVLGNEKRTVRVASLAAKLDRTGVYRSIRVARRLVAASTARA